LTTCFRLYLALVFPLRCESEKIGAKNEKFEKDFGKFNKLIKLGLVKSC